MRHDARHVHPGAGLIDAYRARLSEFAEQAVTGISRLGLARIAYEGNCALTADVNGRTLRVLAEMRQ